MSRGFCDILGRESPGESPTDRPYLLPLPSPCSSPVTVCPLPHQKSANLHPPSSSLSCRFPKPLKSKGVDGFVLWASTASRLPGRCEEGALVSKMGRWLRVGAGASWHLGLFALAYLESNVLCLGEFSPQILSCLDNKDICIVVINMALALPAVS